MIDRVPYLAEILAYEHALIRATVYGATSHVEWTADPTAILRSLDLGRRPGQLPPVASSMTISAT